MKKTKKRVNAIKLIFLVAGVVAAIAAIGALVAMWKKKVEAEKKREAEIEEEIRTILEEKLSDVEAISEKNDEAEGEIE
jgi:flagellar basal body-associated protein FliL